jgi:hypothetical protein
MNCWTLLKSTIAIKFYDISEIYGLNRGKMNLGTYSRRRMSFLSNSADFKTPSIAPFLLISDHSNRWSLDYLPPFQRPLLEPQNKPISRFIHWRGGIYTILVYKYSSGV